MLNIKRQDGVLVADHDVEPILRNHANATLQKYVGICGGDIDDHDVRETGPLDYLRQDVARHLDVNATFALDSDQFIIDKTFCFLNSFLDDQLIDIVKVDLNHILRRNGYAGGQLNQTPSIVRHQLDRTIGFFV